MHDCNPASEAEAAGLHLVLTWKNVALGGLALVALAGVGVAGWFLLGEGTAPEPKPIRSIAVLPLENLTGDPEKLYFTLGLTEELATELNRFQDIVVIACGGSTEATESSSPVADSGGPPCARFLLRGTVRTDPSSFRVSLQLTDAADGRQLWAEAYTHPLEASRFIATQEEIARRVVAAIASEYGIIARRLAAESRKKPPAELDTYEAMLRYYSHQIAPTPESAAVGA